MGVTQDVGEEEAVRLQLLGPVQLVVGDRAIALGGARQAALVAFLALQHRPVPTATIVDQVWGSEAPRTVVKSMSTLLSRVRPLLEAHGVRIVLAPAGYQLEAPPGTVDAHAFRDAVGRSRIAELGGDLPTAIEELTDALDCWNGPALAGLDAPFADTARSSLTLEREAAIVHLAAMHQQRGEHDAAVGLLRPLAERAPLREDRQVALMQALTRAGRPDEAVAVYDAAHERLVEELGLEPGPLLEEALQDAVRPTVSADIVGRGKELESLDDAVKAAMRREMRIVVITGEPGAGKSHLVRTFADRIAGRGFHVLVGRCEPTATVPFHALLQILGQILELGLLSPDPDVYPTLWTLLEADGGNAAGDAGDLRRRLILKEITEAVDYLAAQGPLIVVIEDFHHADPMTLAVVENTSYSGVELPATLVLTARESELLRGGAVELALAEVAAHSNVHRLELAPLSDDEITELVAREHPGVAADPAHLALILEGCGGNPLYALLVARHLADHEGDDSSLPGTIVDLLEDRVLAVPERGRQLLLAASVLGLEFGVDDAAALLGDDQRLRQLRTFEARRSGLLHLSADGQRLRFTHGIVQRVAYGLTTPAQRAELHLAASRLRRVGAVGDLEVVHHLVNARPLVSDVEVADHILAAARRTIDHGAYGSAVRLLAAGEQLQVDPARRAEASILRTVAEVAEGHRTPVADLDAAIDAAEAAGRWDLVADGLVARARMGRVASTADIEQYSARIESTVASGELDQLRVGYLRCHQAEALFAIDVVAAKAVLEVAEEIAATLHDGSLERRVERLRIVDASAQGGRADEVVPRGMDLLARSMAAADVTTAALVAHSLQGARLRQGDLVAFLSDIDRFIALAGEVGRHDLVYLLRAQRSGLSLATEPLAAAEEAADALRTEHRGTSRTLVEITWMLQLWWIRREQVALSEHEELLRSVVGASNRAGLSFLLGACLLERGALDEARELLAPLPAAVLAAPPDWGRIPQLAAAIDLAIDLDLPLDVDALRPVLTRAAGDIAVMGGGAVLLGRVDRYLGRLEGRAGDLDAAVVHLSTARRLDRDAGLGLWAGWAARDEGVARRQRAHPGDDDEAVRLLDSALRTAKRYGSTRLARAVQAQF